MQLYFYSWAFSKAIQKYPPPIPVSPRRCCGPNDCHPISFRPLSTFLLQVIRGLPGASFAFLVAYRAHLSFMLSFILFTLLKLEEFENAGFSFSCGRKHFENGAFRKRRRHDNHVISLTESSSNTNTK